MSTRAYIGMVNSDSSVKYCYNHYDGYPSSLGKELLTHFNSKEKISNIFNGKNVRGIEKGVVDYFDDDEEENIPFEDKGAFLDFADEDYTYLFEHEKWYFRNWNGVLKELTMDICNQDED
jgi:hypothetical protein